MPRANIILFKITLWTQTYHTPKYSRVAALAGPLKWSAKNVKT